MNYNYDNAKNMYDANILNMSCWGSSIQRYVDGVILECTPSRESTLRTWIPPWVMKYNHYAAVKKKWK